MIQHVLKTCPLYLCYLSDYYVVVLELFLSVNTGSALIKKYPCILDVSNFFVYYVEMLFLGKEQEQKKMK